ncbi:hypothetical protein EIP91_006658 [Steccherinum ochraceum]|uniref:BTB domain-containing protein n=1 Tax=Steccherinum ochraceum TaxID=92696 RepID=A0A4R0RJW0_9APHY|nr:hypothetical protein EIP91_006658 [Steccherinum ochraceum]
MALATIGLASTVNIVSTEPFNQKRDGCIVVRSSDGHDFYVQSCILELASPVFASLISTFKLQDPDIAAAITIPELDSTQLTHFLRILYPAASSTSLTVNQMDRMYEVGKMYRATAITSRVEDLVDIRATFIYSIWELYGESCVELAEGTAGYPDLDKTTSGAYFRILWFIERRGEVPACFTFTRRTPGDGTCSDLVAHTIHPFASDFLDDKAFERIPADIVVQSGEGQSSFFAHKASLILASPILAKKIAALNFGSSTGLPVLVLPENHDVMRLLLRFCYGFTMLWGAAFGNTSDLALVAQAIQAAVKYAIPHVIDTARSICEAFLAEDPMKAYFMAVGCVLKSEATRAARLLSRDSVPFKYIPAMEHAPAKTYYRLLRYRAATHEAAAGAFDKFTFKSEDSPADVSSSTSSSVTGSETLVSEDPFDHGTQFFGVVLPGNLPVEKRTEVKNAINEAVDKVELEIDSPSS